jgi:hypothetical protein
MVKHIGDYWTGLECNRLSLRYEYDVETLSLIDSCGFQCHYRNILQLLAYCPVVLCCVVIVAVSCGLQNGVAVAQVCQLSLGTHYFQNLP